MKYDIYFSPCSATPPQRQTTNDARQWRQWSMQHKQHTRTQISGGRNANLVLTQTPTTASATDSVSEGIPIRRWVRGLCGQSFHCGNQQRHNAFSHLAGSGSCVTFHSLCHILKSNHKMSNRKPKVMHSSLCKHVHGVRACVCVRLLRVSLCAWQVKLKRIVA